MSLGKWEVKRNADKYNLHLGRQSNTHLMPNYGLQSRLQDAGSTSEC